MSGPVKIPGNKRAPAAAADNCYIHKKVLSDDGVCEIPQSFESYGTDRFKTGTFHKDFLYILFFIIITFICSGRNGGMAFIVLSRY